MIRMLHSSFLWQNKLIFFKTPTFYIQEKHQWPKDDSFCFTCIFILLLLTNSHSLFFSFWCNRNTLSVPSILLFTSCWEEASLNTDFRERFSTESNDQTKLQELMDLNGQVFNIVSSLSYFSSLKCFMEFWILSCVRKLQISCQSNKIAFRLCVKEEVRKNACVQCTCIMLCRT